MKRLTYRPQLESLEERCLPSITTLIETGASWKYLDNGSDQGVAWRSSAFNDSTWSSGQGQLGYGDGDEQTVVDYGANASAKFSATYFRHAFNVDGSYTSLNLRLLRDDGAVVYVNGTEVFRSNMPTGAITFLTRASSGVIGAAEKTYLQTSLSPSALSAGNNVIAVEIHQSSGTSSDISFDLELSGDTSTTPAPAPAPVTKSFQDGVFPSSSYSGTQDTQISSSGPNTNYGTAASLTVDGEPDNAVLLKWDLSAIPAGSTIQAVTLGLNIVDGTSHTYEIYEMKRAWVEGEATWNNFAGASGWQTAGAKGSLDRGSTVLGTIVSSGSGLKSFTWNAAGLALVQSWLNSPANNHGIVIQDYASASDGVDFSASEQTTAAKHPKLTVTYIPGSGTPLPNQSPVANKDTLTVPKGGSGSVNVLANDVDPEGAVLSVSTYTQPAHGTLVRNGGVFTYTPQPTYTGSDSFSYTVRDSGGLTASASVSITVTAGTVTAATPITFRVMGDVPYTSGEFRSLERDLDNVGSKDEFFVHLGDIKSANASCSRSAYEKVADTLQTSSIPLFIVPGDNEWNDCSKPDAAWALWEDSFVRFENNWDHGFNVLHQSARPENFAFVENGALFIGLNLPGGSLRRVDEWDTVVRADASWITQNFKQFGSQVSTVVLFAQAYPDQDRRKAGDALVAAAKAFAKPVLLMHGDLHAWDLDRPFSKAPNITRVVVDEGVPSVRVTVTGDPSKPFVFDRTP